MSDLRDFVLTFCQEAGGIVEPAAYGIYPVLWPDDLAARLQVDPYQKLAFDEAAAHSAGETEQITQLSYSHPLLDRIIEEARRRPASSRLAVTGLKLEKRGLAELAGKSFSWANLRLTPLPGAQETPALGHYIRFNFKASLMTDEKHERLISVLMHLQGGYPILDQAEFGRAAVLVEATGDTLALPPAPLNWQPPASPPPTAGRSGQKETGPLSPPIITALLERAKAGALLELAAPLASLRQRAERHLELDRARLEQYYDDLQADLERRLSKAAEERRPALADKLAAMQAERQNKLLDIQAKYELRLTLELINLAIIVQPKIILPVQLANRHTTLNRTITWDPLLHRLEPLACEVCGQPSYELFLCVSGHLAHKSCLAPQCVDCKRVYCQLCQEQIKSCVVCDRPVCSQSLSQCPECGRVTCQEHRGLCHAEAGQPRRLVAAAPEPAPSPPEPEQVEARPAQARNDQKRQARKQAPTRSSQGAARRTPASPSPRLAGQKIEVYLQAAEPVLTAYVIAKGREVAARTWQLTPTGIAVWCQCEKGRFCPAHGSLIQPETADRIEAQLQSKVNDLRQEYQVPANRINFFYVVNDIPRPEYRLSLRGWWKNEEVLAQARAGFNLRLRK